MKAKGPQSRMSSFFTTDKKNKNFLDYLYLGLATVFPGGRSHRQITQNRPCKKIICGVKLVAVKVAVGGHWVL